MQEDAGTVSRAVLTGPAAAIPGFDVALASELGLPVELGVVDGAPDGLDAGRVTVAAGLALMEAPA
jgi:type IV pilus assembly protein PilM